MHLISVHIGEGRKINNAKPSGKTGIYKRPVASPVPIGLLGLQGDVIVDSQNHGGVDQAVYIYGEPDYQWWSTELDRELSPGTFGENLTISDLESAQICIGDRLHVGTTLLEITAPRIPCITLAVRMGDPAFAKRFRAAERPGVYCRVIQPGQVQMGDPVTLASYTGDKIKAVEIFRAVYVKDLDEETIRRFLAAPIDFRSRRYWKSKLKKLTTRTSDPHMRL
jgi:MOSC domain-containing protein YiiM